MLPSQLAQTIILFTAKSRWNLLNRIVPNEILNMVRTVNCNLQGSHAANAPWAIVVTVHFKLAYPIPFSGLGHIDPQQPPSPRICESAQGLHAPIWMGSPPPWTTSWWLGGVGMFGGITLLAGTNNIIYIYILFIILRWFDLNIGQRCLFTKKPPNKMINILLSWWYRCTPHLDEKNEHGWIYRHS